MGLLQVRAKKKSQKLFPFENIVKYLLCHQGKPQFLPRSRVCARVETTACFLVHNVHLHELRWPSVKFISNIYTLNEDESTYRSRMDENSTVMSHILSTSAILHRSSRISENKRMVRSKRMVNAYHLATSDSIAIMFNLQLKCVRVCVFRGVFYDKHSKMKEVFLDVCSLAVSLAQGLEIFYYYYY